MQAVLICMHGEEVALVAVGQLLKGHGRRINQRVEQIQSCFVHEPRELIHEALVTDGRQIDQGRAFLGFEVPSARIKIHMGKNILRPKGNLIQIASLKFKRRICESMVRSFMRKSRAESLAFSKSNVPWPVILEASNSNSPSRYNSSSKISERCSASTEQKPFPLRLQSKICFGCRHKRMLPATATLSYNVVLPYAESGTKVLSSPQGATSGNQSCQGHANHPSSKSNRL